MTDSGKDSPSMSTESSSWSGSAVQNFNHLAHRIAYGLHLEHHHDKADHDETLKAPSSPSSNRERTVAQKVQQLEQEEERDKQKVPQELKPEPKPEPGDIAPSPQRPRAVSSGNMPMPEVVMPMPEQSDTPSSPGKTPATPPASAASPARTKSIIPPGLMVQMKPSSKQQQQQQQQQPPSNSSERGSKFEVVRSEKQTEDPLLPLDDDSTSDFSVWQLPHMFGFGGSGH